MISTILPIAASGHLPIGGIVIVIVLIAALVWYYRSRQGSR
jgi:hypothetical protein